VMKDHPDTVRALVASFLDHFRAGELRPLPHRVFPVSRACRENRPDDGRCPDRRARVSTNVHNAPTAERQLPGHRRPGGIRPGTR
jgi:hypothetical protein